MKYIKKVDVTQLISNTGTIIDSMNTQDDQHTNAPSIDAIKNYIDNIVTTKHTWNLIAEHYNTGNETVRHDLVIDLQQYSEILLTVGNGTSTNRALATTTIPISMLPTGAAADGQHQAIYYTSANNFFRSGVSYVTSNSTLMMYVGASSAMRVYAR